jgi:glyoxylase-like metal-dependent hydrolase (beta-lactamase superfamily II)
LTQDHDLQYLGLNAKIIHTPGHTDGSLTVILDSKHAIVGDTLIGSRGKSVFPPFADDPETLMKSWKKLIDEGIEFLYPGHGSPFGVEKLTAEFDAAHIS